jgi:hypothetical protein
MKLFVTFAAVYRMQKIKSKKDRYTNARGGSSKIFQLACGKCKSIIATYQKDGPGNLIRMYLDRIQSDTGLIFSNKLVSCKNCNSKIGILSNYKPENREAIFLERGAIVKSVI